MRTVFVAGLDGTKPYLDIGEAHLDDGSRQRLLRTLGGDLKLAPSFLVREDREEARRVFRQVRAFRARGGSGLTFHQAAARLATSIGGRAS